MQRLRSLDIFRGATVAPMILVNDPGGRADLYPPLVVPAARRAVGGQGAAGGPRGACVSLREPGRPAADPCGLLG